MLNVMTASAVSAGVEGIATGRGKLPGTGGAGPDFAQLLMAQMLGGENASLIDDLEEAPAETPGEQTLLGLFDVLPARDVASKFTADTRAGGASVTSSPVTDALLGKKGEAATGIQGPLTAGNDPTANFAAELGNEVTELVQHAAAPAKQAAPTPAHNTEVKTPVADPNWGNEFSEKIVWLAKGNVQNAQINVTPAQLGPIQINISLNGDQLSAAFVSAHSEVRQALEESLPRLRELLSQSGINLGQASVDSQASQQQHSPEQSPRAHRSSNEGAILSGDVPNETSGTIPIVAGGQGLVDLFA